MTSKTPEPDWTALLHRDAPPAPDPAGPANTLRLLRTLPPPRPTGWTFLCSQAGFIRKRMWVAQFAVLAGVLALVWAGERSGSLPHYRYALCAGAAPLLLVANVRDLARVYHQGMLELELATRYSLAKITAARLLIFGVCDGILLALLAGAGALACGETLWVVLLYCLTPFCWVSALCLALLRRARPAVFGKAALAVSAAALAVLVLPVQEIQRRLYGLNARPFWAASLFLALLALAWQARRLTRGGLRATL